MTFTFTEYLNNDDSDCTKKFKEAFQIVIPSFPNKVCTYRVIHKICLPLLSTSNRNLLNKVWMNYFKTKLYTGTDEKIEKVSDSLIIR